MFETAVLSNGPQTKRVWTTFLGFAGQAALLTCLVLAPLISPQALPKVVWSTMTVAPPPPPPPPLPPVTQIVPRTHLIPTHSIDFTAPVKVPPKVLMMNDIELAPDTRTYVAGGVPGGVLNGGPNGVITDIIKSVGPATPVYRPPERVVTKAPLPETVKPPRITVLEMAEPIQRIPPVYPSLARTAHVSGKVELMAVLGTDGRLHEVKVVSGHPLLVKAAVDAVMQWLYRPTILNGQPVEVQAPITVRFILN